MKQLPQAVPLQLVKGRSGIGGGGLGGKGGGSGANMSARQSGCKKTEQRSHPECERGRRLRGTGGFKWNSLPSNYLRSEGWGRHVDSRGFRENRRNDAVYHSTAPFYVLRVEMGGRTWSSERFKRQNVITSL